MNLDQIVNLITRLFLRRAVNTAVTKGLDMATRGGGKAGGRPPASPAEAEQARKARELARRARQALRLTRRLGR